MFFFFKKKKVFWPALSLTRKFVPFSRNDLNFCYVQIKKAAQKRKEEDADFEEKRMILGITAEGDEDENDKENLMRRREMIRSRLEKEPLMFGQEEEDIRHRRGGDVVSRWRDKRDSSPVHYRVSVL